MAKSRLVLAGALVAAVLVLVSCAAGPNNVAQVSAPHIAGFWLGLWHGLISPVTFLVSLFTSNVNIYDVHNNGNWYNFGFILGGVHRLLRGGPRRCLPGRPAGHPLRRAVT